MVFMRYEKQFIEEKNRRFRLQNLIEALQQKLKLEKLSSDMLSQISRYAYLSRMCNS